MEELEDVGHAAATLRARLDEVILGQDRVKDLSLACLLAGGHALLEGAPGTGKTLLVLALARLVGGRFRRVQFTPDLMPADLLGSNILDLRTHDFVFREGPVFTDLLLADEVNRTPPRTQSALLEAMSERAVTTDGVRREISKVFTVFATQNPIEFEGTYPLPEAQKDRFLVKIDVPMPSEQDEGRMLAAYAEGRRLADDVVGALPQVLDVERLLAARRIIERSVRVEPAILRYALLAVRATRDHGSVQHGAGPRAALSLLAMGRAQALLAGRDFVIPDDIKRLAVSVLAHRIILTPEAEMEGLTLPDLVGRIFESLEVPR